MTATRWFILTALLMALTWELARSLCPSVPLQADSPHIVLHGQSPMRGCYRVDLPLKDSGRLPQHRHD
jgi:hypothetical protein